MKITSLEEKRRQKAMSEMVKLPVYDSIYLNDDGQVMGKLVDYKEIPRYYLENEGDL
ncbi:hypothetical protein [Oceanobacillus sp. J11TS1]|uniref:hypothetical protein n=1 Tax=Oceanobacillus sp. J11TS1 TaxID=2807191 RepID=UPI001B1B91E1|nr:hypothetical protein [Oceanobacillus sp. J11TS1]GIO23923.1 hypothetical protein J11TS1_25040 [Oceanobacillus sp. J11TS1]